MLVAFGYGYRFEQVLRRLGFSRSLSYVDAGALEYDIEARDQARKNVLKEMESPRILKLRLANPDTDELYVKTVSYDIKKDSECQKFVEGMEKVVDLLGLFEVS